MKSLERFELDPQYAERVYAGVLGKIIGVYLGRPFEQWSNERIERELGEITYYVHEKLGKPLIVTDDDISGTFTFFRALPENGNDPLLSPAQIGDWWLNTIVEKRTILWWGGIGVSTEHTAYLRLKAGHRAPQSGSTALNGKAVAEEIGAQIFADGWGLLCPGDPERAADLARRAGSVSHDGEAIYGASVVAALIAQAFVESDIATMLKTAQSLIPSDSIIFELISNIVEWAAENGDDWRATLRQIHAVYPYSRFGTNCPMVSNHAIVLLALLHGGGNFAHSLTIANTAGYDTDCNSGNVGCIVGVMGGLAGIDAGPNWRGPVADRLYLPTADGGRAITDAVRETYEIVNSARSLAGSSPLKPKNGAKFHFSLAGSVQGFTLGHGPDCLVGATVSNRDSRLSVSFADLGPSRTIRVGTATFTPPYALAMGGYALVASPTLYSGQTITALLSGDTCLSGRVQARIYVSVYTNDDSLVLHRGPAQTIEPGAAHELSYTAPNTQGAPIAEVGVEISDDTIGVPVTGAVSLNWLTWGGCPNIALCKPAHSGAAWAKAWVNGAEEFHTEWVDGGFTYRIVQNSGTGIVSQGTADWNSYEVSAKVAAHLARRIGLAACVCGLRRYIAIMLDWDHRIRLIQQHDGEYKILAESGITWQYGDKTALSLAVADGNIVGRAGTNILTAVVNKGPTSGAVAFIVDEGRAEFGDVRVRPAS